MWPKSPEICLTTEERSREKPQPGNTRPRIEPGPAAWEVPMLPLGHSGGPNQMWQYFNDNSISYFGWWVNGQDSQITLYHYILLRGIPELLEWLLNLVLNWGSWVLYKFLFLEFQISLVSSVIKEPERDLKHLEQILLHVQYPRTQLLIESLRWRLRF